MGSAWGSAPLLGEGEGLEFYRSGGRLAFETPGIRIIRG